MESQSEASAGATTGAANDGCQGSVEHPHDGAVLSGEGEETDPRVSVCSYGDGEPCGSEQFAEVPATGEGVR